MLRVLAEFPLFVSRTWRVVGVVSGTGVGLRATGSGVASGRLRSFSLRVGAAYVITSFEGVGEAMALLLMLQVKRRRCWYHFNWRASATESQPQVTNSELTSGEADGEARRLLLACAVLVALSGVASGIVHLFPSAPGSVSLTAAVLFLQFVHSILRANR